MISAITGSDSEDILQIELRELNGMRRGRLHDGIFKIQSISLLEQSGSVELQTWYSQSKILTMNLTE